MEQGGTARATLDGRIITHLSLVALSIASNTTPYEPLPMRFSSLYCVWISRGVSCERLNMASAILLLVRWKEAGGTGFAV